MFEFKFFFLSRIKQFPKLFEVLGAKENFFFHFYNLVVQTHQFNITEVGALINRQIVLKNLVMSLVKKVHKFDLISDKNSILHHVVLHVKISQIFVFEDV